MKYSKLERVILPLAYGLCVLSVLGMMATTGILIWANHEIEGNWATLLGLAGTFAVLAFGSATLLGAIEFRGTTRQSNDDS